MYFCRPIPEVIATFRVSPQSQRDFVLFSKDCSKISFVAQTHVSDTYTISSSESSHMTSTVSVF